MKIDKRRKEIKKIIKIYTEYQDQFGLEWLEEQIIRMDDKIRYAYSQKEKCKLYLDKIIIPGEEYEYEEEEE